MARYPGLVAVNPARTPEWWMQRLGRQLMDRQAHLRRMDRYYSGDHPLVYATSVFRQKFGNLFADLSDNWCDLVVDAVEERLDVQGFRFGESPDADEDAWEMWQYHQLDSQSQMLHTDALVYGTSYVSVGAKEAGEKWPCIAIEHPQSTIVACDPGHPQKRLAALKAWNDDGRRFATVYLPDATYRYESIGTAKEDDAWSYESFRPGDWQPRGDGAYTANPTGIVPVVEFKNEPRLLKPGVSEMAKVIPAQDAVNKLMADMLIASEFAAYAQRYAIGLEVDIDDNGEPVPPFPNAAIDRMLVAESPDVKFGQFEASNLANYVTAIETCVQHIASRTRTPPHYFYLSGQFPSGESLRAAETGLVAKARRKQRHFGEDWESVMRLAFAFDRDERADFVAAETIWKDPESRTESQHLDALTKAKTLGVPDRQLQEDTGWYTPAQIARFPEMRAEEALVAMERAQMFGPIQQPPGAQPGQPPQQNGQQPPPPAMEQ